MHELKEWASRKVGLGLDWVSMHCPVPALFVVFLISFVFALLVFCYLIGCSVPILSSLFAGFIPTDATSSRYGLSALIQSEAAILAVVITLSLVAVQLTASSFSPRAIEVFRKSPVLWLLLGSYIIAIVLSLVVLDRIPSSSNEFSELYRYIVAAYILGALCIIALVPYMLSIFHLLKPSTIIEKLAKEITKEKLLNKDKEDVLQPIVDICASSMQRYDYETARYGLGKIGDKTVKILHKMGSEHPSEKDKEDGKIAKSVCAHLERLGRLAVRLEDEECAIEVVKNIEKVGKLAAAEKRAWVAREVAYALGRVGKLAAEERLKDAALMAASALKEIGREAVKEGLNDAALDTVSALREIGMEAAEERLKDAALEAAIALKEIGMAAVEKGLERVAREVAYALGRVGKLAAKEGLKDAAEAAASALKDIGMEVVKEGLKDAALDAVSALKDIGMAAAEEGLKVGLLDERELSLTVEESLVQIKKQALAKKLDVVVRAADKAMEEIKKARTTRSSQDE